MRFDSRIVVLPAWRDVDLLQYAKLMNWVVDSGLRKIKRHKTPVAKLVKEQYFYSSGSLRGFSFELVYDYGGGQSKSQLDRFQRHYVTDCNREVEYHDSRWEAICGFWICAEPVGHGGYLWT
ncbi:uncharacterized protein PHALS_01135 [Plasmopara halstedii]|uniref:Uncharacterized protein n=1 Tax=Plasmopara halstedii TaxID=4781 RepID=A0A0P1ASK4_PLAHL|nr:uncharacterized protein PHALS_01135 [Plasmopara halstedii]CEG44799.1 hypothetical protein PHALS_01135 [Plasmopara halstedii]|eukprot:XP_024581168.1 hypothetical protein PHALS_01135 [Plasmopara halstedii]